RLACHHLGDARTNRRGRGAAVTRETAAGVATGALDVESDVEGSIGEGREGPDAVHWRGELVDAILAAFRRERAGQVEVLGCRAGVAADREGVGRGVGRQEGDVAAGVAVDLAGVAAGVVVDVVAVVAGLPIAHLPVAADVAEAAVRRAVAGVAGLHLAGGA